MVRIAGIDLPENQLIAFALTRLYGVGRSNVQRILKEAAVAADKRVHTLSEDEVLRIQRVLDKSFIIEGDLRRQVAENIMRLKTIGSYRGLRHSRGLPARGQRTRSNARTKRGKRQTVGAMKKDDRAKLDQPDKAVSATK